MFRKSVAVCAVSAMLLLPIASINAAITTLDQFSPALGTLVGCGFDHTTNTVWLYDSFGATLSQYDSKGALLISIARPGESANDVDVEIAPENLTLGTTAVPAGTIIFINGESGVAELYAVNPVTGAVLGSLTSAFGVSHVVGGAYHADRNTFFLVQDKVPGGVNANRIAEIDPISGAVLNTFQTTGIFSVNFGDLDIHSATGNLMLVSSDESAIGEFTPLGALVLEHALPAGVTSLSGIGIHEGTCEAWVSGTGGTVWRLGGLPDTENPGDITDNGVVDVDDLLEVINGWGPCGKSCDNCDADIAPPCGGNCIVDVDDLLTVINTWG